MEKVYLENLTLELAARSGVNQKMARGLLKSMVETIKKGIANDGTVKVKGLGTFKLVDIEARESVSVNTGRRVLIEGHQKLNFTPEATMKELVNRPFSMFDTVIIN